MLLCHSVCLGIISYMPYRDSPRILLWIPLARLEDAMCAALEQRACNRLPASRKLVNNDFPDIRSENLCMVRGDKNGFTSR
jgi:hypothetical protein